MRNVITYDAAIARAQNQEELKRMLATEAPGAAGGPGGGQAPGNRPFGRG